jgi:hypothetical protein
MVAMATRTAIDELALKLDDTVFALIETVAVDEGSLAKRGTVGVMAVGLRN